MFGKEKREIKAELHLDATTHEGDEEPIPFLDSPSADTEKVLRIGVIAARTGYSPEISDAIQADASIEELEVIAARLSDQQVTTDES